MQGTSPKKNPQEQSVYPVSSDVTTPEPSHSFSDAVETAHNERGLYTHTDLQKGAVLREAAYIQAASRYHLQRLEAQLDAVIQIGQTLVSTLDPEQILTLLMEKITQLMEADRSTLFLVDRKNNQIWSKVVQGEEVVQIRLPIGQGIAGWVAQTGETVNIKDAYNDPRFDAGIDKKSGYTTRTILTMALRNQHSEIVGVIQVLNKRGKHPFRDEDEQLLQAITAQAVIFLENARLYQELWHKHVELQRTSRKLEQRTHELDIVFEIEQQMSSAFEHDAVISSILERVATLLFCEAGAIALKEPNSDQFHYHAVTGICSLSMNEQTVGLGEGFIGWSMKFGEPLLTNEAKLDPRYSISDIQPESQSLRSVLCVPLRKENQLIGCICLFNKRHTRGFTADDLRILRQIGSQISRAVEIGQRREQQLKENRLATIGQLMSGVMHDLKGPMTIISGYAQMLSQQENAEKRAKFSDAILTQIERLNNMTREVLSFARGESTLLVRKINTNQFVMDLKEHLQQEFEGSGIALIIENTYRGHAHFDEIKLQRLLYNLARNARQAMSPGGEFKIAISSENEKLCIECSDTGPGIPKEIQSQVFDSFVTGRPEEGSGLGLAIVQKIVSEHQGSIRFSSTPGEGTIFYVSLPLGGPQHLNKIETPSSTLLHTGG